MKNKNIDEQINSFLELWDAEQHIAFLRDVAPLIELYDVDEDNDWVEQQYGQEAATLRLIRTVYLVSRIAEFHAGRLCSINARFKNIWSWMENEAAKQERLCEKEAI